MKIFNRSLIFLLLLIGLFAVSCKKDFLDEHLQSSYAPENTLSDSLGFEANMAGIMARIRTQYTTDDDQGLLGAMFLGTDVVINGQTTSAMFPYVNNETMNSSDFAAGIYWRWAYTTLNNVNIVLAAAQDPAVTGTSASNKAYIAAEAKFFRAYVYEFLVTLWGDVPLITSPVRTPRIDFTRTSTDSINTQIIKDLTEAIPVLPANPAAARKEFRPNKAMCQQLLAQVYLRTGKPDLAEAQCQSILTGGVFSLMKTRFGVKATQPGDPFNDLFIIGNQRFGQGNKEAIWTIEQDLNIPGGATSSSSNASTDQHRRMWVPFYAGITNMIICDSLGGRGIGRFRLSNWVLYNLYDQYDIRNSPYNIRRVIRFNDPTKPLYNQQLTIAHGDTVWRIAPYTTKWNNFNPADINGYGSYKDLPMMRLAETYLLQAEARFKQGNLQGAADAINEIRKRAYPDYPLHGMVLATDINLNFILDERARELLSEENRRMTLLRTGTLVQRCQNYLNAYNTAAGQPVTGLSNVTARKGLFPIPQSAIDLNKGAVLGQNTGY